MNDRLPLPHPRLPGDRAVTTDSRAGQSRTVLGIVAAVVAPDQISKWWAWRHLPDALINPGSTGFLGSTLSAIYSRPVSGALLDILDFCLLGVLVWILVRHRRSRAVLGSAAVMLAGWGSNLLDRLGLHTVTAPDSVRGAVDFLPLGSYCYNLADLCISGGTAVLLVVASRGLVRRFDHPLALGPLLGVRRAPRPARGIRRPRSSAVPLGLAGLAAALVLAVVLGAIHDTGVDSPAGDAPAALAPAGSPD